MWRTTAVAVGAAAGLLYLFGPLTAASTAMTLAFASAWSESAAVVCLILVIVGLLGVAGWIVFVRVVLPSRTTRRVAAAGAVLLAVAVVMRLRGGESSNEAEHPAVSQRCLFTGYSAAADSGLRPGTHGVGRLLQTEFGVCVHSVAAEPRPGRTLEVIRDLACATPALVERGGPLLFFGGSNDDLMSWLVMRSGFVQLLYQLRTFVTQIYFWKPGVDTILRLEHDASEASLRVVDEQVAILRELAACATRGQFGIVFGQDFVVLDLDGGRRTRGPR